MKRVLKWIAAMVGAVVLILVVAVAIVYVMSSRRMAIHYSVASSAIVVPTTPQAAAEGKRLFFARGCVDCHGANLAGQVFVQNPAIGVYAGANLTKGRGGVGSTLSDPELATAIREGVAPDGRALIFMPSADFHGLSDSDVGALIAFIRSAPPVDAVSPSQVVGPLARILLLAGKMPVLVPASLIDHKTPMPLAPSVGPTVEYGKYLAQGCTGCHGDGFSGGPIPGGPPDWPPAMNLTSDLQTGLGQWNFSAFEKAMRHGVTPAGTTLRPPMPWTNFAYMTDVEVQALWDFLHSLPPKPAGNH
jgi:cytochrome c5